MEKLGENDAFSQIPHKSEKKKKMALPFLFPLPAILPWVSENNLLNIYLAKAFDYFKIFPVWNDTNSSYN